MLMASEVLNILNHQENASVLKARKMTQQIKALVPMRDHLISIPRTTW